MNILSIVAANLRRGPRTRRLPDRPVPAEGFRGRVELDAAACRSCSKCAQVCVSSAITFEKVDPEHYVWAYDPARCTYCGLCITYCPVDCLWQAPDRTEAWRRPDEQAEVVTVEKKRRKKAVAQ